MSKIIRDFYNDITELTGDPGAFGRMTHAKLRLMDKGKDGPRTISFPATPAGRREMLAWRQSRGFD